jgi:hypothetical protein
MERLTNLKAHKDIRVSMVTGASGSGKDSFVDAMNPDHHIRFGDVMKDLAFDYGMVPHSRLYYELNREARHDVLPCGRTVLEAWIALDVLRQYNPFVFIEIGLERLVSTAFFGSAHIVFSGMRTEAGLEVAEGLSDISYKVVRQDHVPPSAATLDELQVKWPCDKFIMNSGSLEELQELGRRVC